MEDKEDNSTNPSRSMSSSLSDSWSVVNRQGDVLDDESCSTASSVEVVEEDEEENTSLGASLSPSNATPTGPLFVLRLSSHDVSDTDDDQAPSEETESTTVSRSFDILDAQNQTTGMSVKSDLSLISSEGQTGDTVPTQPETQVRTSPPKVMEEVKSLVKALDDVQSNLKPRTDVPNSSAMEDCLTDKPMATANPDLVPETIIPTESNGTEMEVETIGIKPVGDDEGMDASVSSNMDASVSSNMEASVSSNFSFLGPSRETSPEGDDRESREFPVSTVMNQSMERTETAGDQEIVESSERREPDTVTSSTDVEPRDQSEDRGFWKRCKQLYNFLMNLYEHYTQGSSGGFITLSLCFVTLLVACLSTTYITYTMIEGKDQAIDCKVKNSLLEKALDSCSSSEKSLKLKLADGDKDCISSLREAFLVFRRWTYTAPDSLQSEVDRYFTQSESFCEMEQDCGDETDIQLKLATLEKKSNTMTFLLKRVIEENINLKGSVESYEQEIAKLKADLTYSEYVNSLKDRGDEQDEKSKWPGGDEDEEKTNKAYVSNEDVGDEEEGGGDRAEDEDEEETERGRAEEDDVLLEECLNTLVRSYKRKFKQAYDSQYEWPDFGSRPVREYLFGYLQEIIPDNLMQFLQRMKEGDAQPDNESEDFNKDTSSFTDRDNSKSDENYFQEEDTDGSKSRHWSESVLEIMNRTRIELQETWKQVKNVSKELWTKHEPAVSKLQNTFTKKLQRLSDKFQDKLATKIKKWFYKKGQKKENKESFGQTTRRKGSMDEDEMKVKKDCSRKVLNVQVDITSLDATSFKRNGDEKTILKRLKRIRKRGDIPEDSVVLKTWLDCQIDWWSNNFVRPFEMPQFLISDTCFDSIECWQVEISEGEHGIGRKKCRKLKRASGNVIAKVCEGYGTFEDLEQGMYDDDETLHSRDNIVNEQSNLDDEDDDDDDFDDYEAVENWFLQRAEMRKYMHDEPDDWYFRRFKKWQQELPPSINKYPGNS